jgi:hypothetical protein
MLDEVLITNKTVIMIIFILDIAMIIFGFIGLMTLIQLTYYQGGCDCERYYLCTRLVSGLILVIISTYFSWNMLIDQGF